MMDESFTSWLVDMLGEARATKTLAVLGEMSPPVNPEDAEWLREIVLLANDLPLPTAPPILEQDIRQIALRDEPPDFWTATPVLDTRSAFQPNEHRGASTMNSWSTTYACVGGEIVIDFQESETGLHRLDGQLLLVNDGLLFRVLLAGSNASHHTETDELGQFEFEAIPPGSYQLRLSAGVVVVELELRIGHQPDIA